MYHYLGEDVATAVDINGQPIGIPPGAINGAGPLTAGSTAWPAPSRPSSSSAPGLFGLSWMQLLGLAAVALVLWWAWSPPRHRVARARRR